ncbi:MAG: Smr/MutS family protein [Bauldia sp.]|nr:Smr/MutS family protein [Bauldia sp.]
MSGGRRRRPLTDEDRALWEAVARTAEPLRPKRKPKRKPAPVAAPEGPPAEPGSPDTPKPPGRAAVPPPPNAATPPRRTAAPATIDRRTTSRVARGTIGLDGRLDLHGFTQDEAYRRLVVFLTEVQRRGGRMVLVITGKGSDTGRAERGILRRVVPQWLGSAAFRPLVSAYDDAHRLHGGGGALYVRIRKG